MCFVGCTCRTWYTRHVQFISCMRCVVGIRCTYVVFGTLVLCIAFAVLVALDVFVELICSRSACLWRRSIPLCTSMWGEDCLGKYLIGMSMAALVRRFRMVVSICNFAEVYNYFLASALLLDLEPDVVSRRL